MAVCATHSSFKNRVAMRQLKLRPDLHVTLETGLRRLTRVNNRVIRAAAIDMQTARAVARFAANILCVIARRLQARMGRGAKIPRYVFMALDAFFRADEFRARNLWRCDDAPATV